MRINYPEEMTKEMRELQPFLRLNKAKAEFEVRPDAPAGTKERYDDVRNRMHEFRKQHAGF